MGRKQKKLEKNIKPQRGWVELHRSLMENPVWYMDDHFSKGQAWVDLILMANHGTSADGKYKRGHIYTSISYLHRHWSWSKEKVINFLQYLVDHDMIIVVSRTSKGLIIRICNYNKYQPEKPTTLSLAKSTTFPTSSNPCESKGESKSPTTFPTTQTSTKPTPNNNKISLNKKKEEEKEHFLSLGERVYKSVKEDLTEQTKSLIADIESGKNIDWQQYEDEDGCMPYQINMVRRFMDVI